MLVVIPRKNVWNNSWTVLHAGAYPRPLTTSLIFYLNLNLEAWNTWICSAPGCVQIYRLQWQNCSGCQGPHCPWILGGTNKFQAGSEIGRKELTCTHNSHDSSHDLPFELRPSIDAVYKYHPDVNRSNLPGQPRQDRQTDKTRKTRQDRQDRQDKTGNLPGQRGETLCRWCVASLRPPISSSPEDFQVAQTEWH